MFKICIPYLTKLQNLSSCLVFVYFTCQIKERDHDHMRNAPRERCWDIMFTVKLSSIINSHVPEVKATQSLRVTSPYHVNMAPNIRVSSIKWHSDPAMHQETIAQVLESFCLLIYAICTNYRYLCCGANSSLLGWHSLPNGQCLLLSFLTAP